MITDVKPIQALTEEQVTMVLKFAYDESPSKYFLVFFLLHTGLRVGEAVHLTWRDLQSAGAPSWTIVVKPEWAKTQKSRQVPISEALQIEILRYGSICGTKTVYWPNLNYPLFPGHKKEGWSIRQIQRHIHDMGKESLGIKVTPHMLRHTFATRLLKVSDIRTVQLILGHVSITSTQIYLNPSVQDLKSAVDKVA